MEPVINPMLIYLVSFCDNIRTISVFLCASTIVAAIVIFFCGILADETDEDKDRYISAIRYSIILFLISLVFVVIVPSRETALTMLAAYYITPDNIQAVQGNIVEFVAQLAAAVKGIQ